MNYEARSIDQTELDRMIDGELTDEDQQSLLERIELAPDGWKQLALAYVEDQVWRSHLKRRVPRAIEPSRSTPSAPVVPAAKETRRRSRVGTARLVATALLAMCCGFLLRGVTNQQDSGLASGTDDGSALESPDGFPNLVSPKDSPAGMTARNQDVMAAESDGIEQTAVPSEYLQLAVSDGRSDQPQLLDVPIRDGIDLADDLFDEAASVVPPGVRELFQQSGHEIEEDRSFWPVSLPDGRQVLVPVSRVRLQFVGDRMHQ